MSNMEAELLTVKDVAKALSLSQRTVWKFHSSGRLPRPVKLGGSVRWRRDELKQWLDAGCPARDVWQQRRVASSH
jgi:excisionase family DNA binding protein